MQSFPRIVASFSIVIAAGFFVGCGGPGAPVSGGSDPAAEAADAVLAPEGGPAAAEKGATDAATPKKTADGDAEAAAPESKTGSSSPEKK